MALVLQWRGDRELSAADVLLGELHLGATYDAIARRRLWHRMPLDVLAIPLAMLAATYLLMLNGASPLVTTAVLCLGAWHRGRQNLGIARYYQQHAGGPSSPVHQWPLRGLLPPHGRRGRVLREHRADARGRRVPQSLAGPGAPVGSGERRGDRCRHLPDLVRRANRGCAAAEAPEACSFIPASDGWSLPTRWASAAPTCSAPGPRRSCSCSPSTMRRNTSASPMPWRDERTPSPGRRRCRGAPARPVLALAAIGLASWALCWWADLAVLDPFLTAGLLGHYWLDGRIWTARARRLGAR